MDCKDAIEELEETEAKLYRTSFDYVQKQYEELIDVIEFNKDMLDEAISQTEEHGYIVSTKYYEALTTQEKDNIKQLEKEQSALLSSLNKAISSGYIKVYSEEWYDMCSEIDAVTLAIEEANTALLEYSNSIRQIEWDVFDLILDRMDQISTEADFLINLMSNYDLYDERGQFTDLGVATTGLHAVNYDTYMAEADEYAKELESLSKEIASDPYNQDLIDRYNEIWEKQQDMILAAEDEKQAIKDLVEEGINREIDALKDLVNEYEDALDAQKDLYDYNNKIKDQTEEIASLQKQLAAYAGDTSEENKARLQQLQVSLEEAQQNLEETEYDRYISDTKKMLDDLVDEYETVLNSRLDDLDALISDMIDMVNLNSADIKDTLVSEAESVGYTLSTNMESIWDTNSTKIADVVTVYGGDISSSLTTISSVLNSISSDVSAMMKSLDSSASSSSKTATSSSSTTSKSATTATKSSSSSSSSSSKSSSSSSSSWGSWFVYRKCYYPKDKLCVNKQKLFTLNTLNCGKVPITPIRYNVAGNGERECGTDLKSISAKAA